MFISMIIVGFLHGFILLPLFLSKFGLFEDSKDEEEFNDEMTLSGKDLDNISEFEDLTRTK